MAWNLNMENKADYNLSGRLTDEVTKIFGLEVNYISTDKSNNDKVLGDIISFSSSSSRTHRVYVYPENTAAFDGTGDMLSKFGLANFNSINLFISAIEMRKIYESDEIFQSVGDLLVLPSSKMLEITFIEHQVPGLNNLYTYGNNKNVYLLKCAPYQFNYDNVDVSEVHPIIPNLDELFDIGHKEEQKADQNAASVLFKGKDPIFGDLG